LFENVKCEEKPCGTNGMWQSVYAFDEGADMKQLPSFSRGHQDILKKLNGYSTVELEVASTIALFLMEGFPMEKALEETKDLKPTRAIPPVLNKAEEILALCSAVQRVKM